MEAINHQGPIPNWYTKLQTECTIGLNQALIIPLMELIIKSLPTSTIPNDFSTHIIIIEQNYFTFFTDGSVKNLTSQNCRIGFRWIETEANVHIMHLHGHTTHLSSALKAETMALVTAVITIPPNAKILIYTDSSNLISTYE
ncbi:hypothetical protein C1645_815064 [Glomus cerebriforme]|uniref:RNase H type-1 domain-containing protein n=1 Tax=Glomus cerebriforme TaxID=658196 RepID=A0A397TEU2_9GLOM|nr:hypothetical protein C1645_815064 [Glomus cerebriforme]